ncbi:MAG: hypothetical protein ACI865_001190 [Flavobacteriaceae bacterium]|jgi:hypothetical protein
MTREEAMIYLPVEDGQDIHDAYEEQLFTAKQFFLNRFPIAKVMNGRLEKLRRVHKAYLILGGHSDVFEPIEIDALVSRTSISEAFSEYNRSRNILKIELNRSKSVPQIDWIMRQSFNVTRNYALLWRVEERAMENIIVGKEPDPMEILSAIKDVESTRHLSFDDLSSLDEENPLKREAKRLSLWLKMEGNE